MPEAVHVPVLGNVNKSTLFVGTIAVVTVTGYMIYRARKKAAAPTQGQYGYGATAYGYASGYYGYGSEFAYGGAYGGGFQPYPVASEYGYGAFGYGYYNPYTGQWLGPGQQQPPVTGGSGSGTGGTGGGTGGGGTGGGGNTHTIKADGKSDLWHTAKNNDISEGKLVRLNPHLSYLVGSKRPIPRGTTVKV